MSTNHPDRKKNTSKIADGLQKIEDSVVGGYKKMETGVVDGYKKMENAVVGGFEKVTDQCVQTFFAKEGESVEEAKKRLQQNRK